VEAVARARRARRLIHSPATASEGLIGRTLYGNDEAQTRRDAAPEASQGCGNPAVLADLHPDEIVLNLGSGAGIDMLLPARRVAPPR
jgi:arsenite methyltransferase